VVVEIADAHAGSPIKSMTTDNLIYDLLKEAYFRKLNVKVAYRDFGMKLCIDQVRINMTMNKEITRKFTGKYTWWGDTSGSVDIKGTGDFILKDFGPEYGPNLWVGIKGTTTDGKLNYEDDYYEPGEVTILNETYSTTNSILTRVGGHAGGNAPRPDIFEDNKAFTIDIKNLSTAPSSAVNIQAELKLDFAPVI
jgi:hypothetical protein